MPLVIKKTGLDQYALGGKARVRMLVVGGPGAGKTRMASFYPKPIYANCESDAGLDSVADREVPHVTINSSTDMLAFLAEMKLESAKPDAQRTYMTVVIDTIDAFQRKVKDEWIQKNPHAGSFTGFDAWNYLDAKVQMLLTRLLNLDMNVIVNVHYATKRGENDGPKEYGLQLDGGIKDKIFNDFSLVGWLDSEWVAKEGKRVEDRYITFAKSPQKEFLKDRLHISPGPKGFPIVFAESDYTQLLDAITSRMAALKPSMDIGEISDYEDPAAVASAGTVAPGIAGPLPEQDPRTVPLEQFDKPTLLKMAREEGIEGIKANWIKTDLINAIKAKRAEQPPVAPPEPTAGVVPPEAVKQESDAPSVSPEPEVAAIATTVEETAPVTEDIGDGTIVDVGTGEVVTDPHDDAIAEVQNVLGGEVISDTQPADVPTLPAEPQPTLPVNNPAAGSKLPESCGDCTKSLEGEAQNYIRLGFIKYKTYTCEECYTHRKNHNGKPRELASV